MNVNAPIAPHPGAYLKDLLQRKRISVTKAAGLLGVGRPALSNVLNASAALTPDMALRLEKAFQESAGSLMAMQTAFDQWENRDNAKEMAVRTFVEDFLRIEARQIAAWADQMPARAELAAFLRRLVHSTGKALSKVDFPAYDNSQRQGWDGTVVTDEATPWIPRGASGWEFGVDKIPAAKADSDYAARTSSVPADERAAMTFVFVTPRNWTGKEAWAKARRAAGEWKDVRAFDANDLEQWLEQSVPAQTWFGEKIGSGAGGLATLETTWNSWASATEWPLSKILFRASVAANKGKLSAWLSAPPITPFVVTADSEGEALAFLACAFEELGTIPGQYCDSAVVVQTVDALRRTTAIAPDFVAIVGTRDVEAASASVQRSHHLIVVRRHDDISGEANITLDLVDDITFREAIVDMGLPGGETHRLSRETANSPTILRRRLSKIPAIKEPAWSRDKDTARALIPLNFAGVWDRDSAPDRDILSFLAGRGYDEIEETVASLRTVEDAAAWSIGRYRGITSKIDVLFATKNFITQEALENFFLVAEIVLSEQDPALDLPADKQWAANIYGKTREHSAALRQGICETLVLLAAHGNHLFRERLNFDVQRAVDELVKKLLLPLDGKTWSSHKSDLPRYAEAAPGVFLDILDRDLASAEPKVHALLASADSGVFSGCPRTGLLWALETLAWSPHHLLPVSRILAKLAQVRISDNWANTPQGSLSSIYSSWMPQTAATVEERNQAMEVVCREFPAAGWKLLTDQFVKNGVGHYNVRPHWRNDASGAGEPFKTWDPIIDVQRKALDLALAWPNHDEKTLGDLVSIVRDLGPQDQQRVWELIEVWAATNPSDAARHALRERVRKSAFTRRAHIRGVTEEIKDRAREAYALLAPTDVVMKHLWLFEQHWVEESSDELEEEDFNYEKREARVGALRKAALTEIWERDGFAGLMRLAELGEAESAIGRLMVESVLPEKERGQFIDRLLTQNGPPKPLEIDNMIAGTVGGLTPEQRPTFLKEQIESYKKSDQPQKAIRLLKCGPFRAETWELLEGLPEEWRTRYWRETYVSWAAQDEREFNYIVDRLIEAGRPLAAFHGVHLSFGKVEPARLARLLREVATANAEAPDVGRLDPYNLAEAFKSLKKRGFADERELVQLEFMHAPALKHTDYPVPTLQAALGKDPMLLMQLASLVFRRSDDGEDPKEWSIADPARRSDAATTAYNIIRHFSRTPGTDDKGEINVTELERWVGTVRTLGERFGRAKVMDHTIGGVFGRCRAAPDGVWPCEPVRQVFDAVASDDIAEGMVVGRLNERGAQFHSYSGDEERALAAQYRGWARKVAFQHPFTAKMLESIAESYDHQAVWHDDEANVRKRLNG